MQYHELDLTAPSPLAGQAAPEETADGLSAQASPGPASACPPNWLLLVLLLLWLGGGKPGC